MAKKNLQPNMQTNAEKKNNNNSNKDVKGKSETFM